MLSIKICKIRNQMDLPPSHEKPSKSIFYQHILYKPWPCSISMLKHSRRIWKFVTRSFRRKSTSSCFYVIMWFMYTITEAFYLRLYKQDWNTANFILITTYKRYLLRVLSILSYILSLSILISCLKWLKRRFLVVYSNMQLRIASNLLLHGH